MPSAGDIFNGVLTALNGGGSQSQYSVDPNSGQVQTTQVPDSKGQLFKNLFSGLITGLAGGVKANAEGMKGPLGAIGGGFEANQERLQQQDQQNRSRAIQNYQLQQNAKREAFEEDMDNQKLILEKATAAREQLKSVAEVQEAKVRTQLMQQDIDRKNYDQAQRKIQDSQKSIDGYNTRLQAGWEKIAPDEFDTTAQAETWANQYSKDHPDFNKDFKPQLSIDPGTNKIIVWKAPTGTQLYKLKMPDGSTVTREMTAEQYVDAVSKLADIGRANSETARNYAEANKIREEGAEGTSTKNALAELDRVDGDYTKLSPGSRETLKTYNNKTMEADVSALKSLQSQRDQLDPGKDKKTYDQMTQDINDLNDRIRDDLHTRQLLNGVKPPPAQSGDPKIAAGQSVIDQQLKSGVPADQVRKHISDAGFSSDQEKTLLQYLDAKAKAATPSKAAANIPDKPGGMPIP